MDLSKLYNSADSVAARASNAPAAAAPAATRPADNGPKLTEDERRAKMYDGPDTTVGPRPSTRPDPTVQAKQEAASRMYDSADSAKLREASQAKPGEAPPAKPAPTTPAATAGDLQLPAGFDAKDPLVGEFRKLAGDAKLDGKAQTQLLELHQRVLASQREVAGKQAQDWRGQLERDGEVMQHAEAARELVATYGGRELQAFLDESGVGNNPTLVRFVVNVAKAMKGARGW
jgi:hypothetical protein